MNAEQKVEIKRILEEIKQFIIKNIEKDEGSQIIVDMELIVPAKNYMRMQKQFVAWLYPKDEK